jgi:hypothetical protein
VPRSGCPLLILVPWSPAYWPTDLGPHAELLHWHPRTSAAMLRRQLACTRPAMSWLQPTDFERRFWSPTCAGAGPRSSAGAAALARQTRVEPLLLRNARLHFLPGSATEIESLLWFSPLIGARSSGEVIFHAGAARLLADELRGDVDRCSRR